MTAAPIKALSWFLPPRVAEQRILFVNARPLAALPAAQTTCIQSFYPYAQQLTRSGYTTFPDWQDHLSYTKSQHEQESQHEQKSQYEQNYDMAILCAPQNILAAQYATAQSLQHLNNNGVLIATAANDAGGKRLGKMISALGLPYEEDSKEKCRIITTRKTAALHTDIAQSWLTAGAEQPVLNGQFISRPGIYGWDKIDKGSALLAQNIPDTLKGIGADLGCGYGFLSASLLQNCPAIKTLYAIDADYNALQCAQRNIQKNLQQNPQQFQTAAKTIWADLTDFSQQAKELRLPPLDFAIMNPPFHEGKITDSTIGTAFITTAHALLRKNGVLYMVANTHLPYESHLNSLFFRTETIAIKEGFKIITCLK